MGFVSAAHFQEEGLLPPGSFPSNYGEALGGQPEGPVPVDVVSLIRPLWCIRGVSTKSTVKCSVEGMLRVKEVHNEKTTYLVSGECCRRSGIIVDGSLVVRLPRMSIRSRTHLRSEHLWRRRIEKMASLFRRRRYTNHGDVVILHLASN